MKIEAMAVSRTKWIERMTASLLGMFGEYVKQRFRTLPNAELVHDHSWGLEIARLAKASMRYYNTSTKTPFDKAKALVEAVDDMGGGLDTKIVEAMSVWRLDAKDFKAFHETLKGTDVDADSWFADMVVEHLPELAKILGGGRK